MIVKIRWDEQSAEKPVWSCSAASPVFLQRHIIAIYILGRELVNRLGCLPIIYLSALQKKKIGFSQDWVDWLKMCQTKDWKTKRSWSDNFIRTDSMMAYCPSLILIGFHCHKHLIDTPFRAYVFTSETIVSILRKWNVLPWMDLGGKRGSGERSKTLIHQGGLVLHNKHFQFLL